MIIASLYGYGVLLILAAVVIAIINAEELQDMNDMIDIENQQWLEARTEKEKAQDKTRAA